MKIRNYNRVKEVLPPPKLMDLQIKSYERFLQLNVPPKLRNPNEGLEAILQETFPITSFDGKIELHYVKYELLHPRFTPDQCRDLKVTYGMPFKVYVQLVREGKEEPVREVYLGEIPKMMGGGEFIINGAERVIVSQLHRSPGIDFSLENPKSDKPFFKCRIIPERGSWIEIFTTKKDLLQIRIDRSGKFSAISFLRALAPQYSKDEDILKEFYPTKKVKLKTSADLEKIIGKPLLTPIHSSDENEKKTILTSGEIITEEKAETLWKMGVREVEIIEQVRDDLILNSVVSDNSHSHEEALLKIYNRLRPGSPAVLEKAQELFQDKFLNPAKYKLGPIARFRINRKFSQQHGQKNSERQPSLPPEDVMTLTPEDLIHSLKYIVDLRLGKGELDDIDHLGNRRVKMLEELVGDEIRKGFLNLKRSVREKMSMLEPDKLSPRNLINAKTISAAIEHFFGRGELSQVVDQTNPLSQLTHERTLSALGPGGLNRKRAGFEVRDVHISHYGRICPIETPEGANIGLISRLGIYASLDKFGFLTTPYRVVKNGKITDQIKYLRADEEDNSILAPADVPVKNDRFAEEFVIARVKGEIKKVEAHLVEYVDVSPKQLVGVSASLIPFLEHDDANRALMGSNMQRQAVPLLRTSPPIVMTGIEKEVARNSGMVVIAEEDGEVLYVDALRIQVKEANDTIREYKLRKFVGLNDRTCLNQTPIVRKGDRVKAGQVIADGAATKNGILSLGKNVLVAFMSWEGYNFEDAIIVSEKLVKEDTYTSIHIDTFETKIRETKLGKEEFTNEIPNVSPRLLKNLKEDGVIRVGTRVKPGDILVGKVVPKSKTELTPEEKLLYAIFGKAGADVRNESLEVPSGTEGIVIQTKKFKRKSLNSDDEKQIAEEIQAIHQRINTKIEEILQTLFENLKKKLGKILPKKGKKNLQLQDFYNKEDGYDLKTLKDVLDPCELEIGNHDPIELYKYIRYYIDMAEALEAERQREIKRLEYGDGLPTGVLELVRVYVATKRVLSVGDKMAGRHGNKGVISKIVPEEDMPFLEDGTPIEIILNPLGVPSRMNVGQILETHLGWAAHKLGFHAITPVFAGATEEDIRKALKEAGLPENGKTKLYDGRTGEPFLEDITVGYIYMMKLHHLVDDKVHARATGPYSLITQQPLGGKARFGGQRFGEMEVWALEAYGAANILQEMLTVKSDDVEGRTKIYESMVKGKNTLEPGTPVSFEVLTYEIKGLGLNLTLHKRKKV
ncbi:MAG: DNA-directed RNA polymerase subunit beta [Planctomycetota bacterium]|nr:MAG: DNA-directed RNA polymerase subunit beta [Planctomycetota bacterium]